MSEVCFVTYKIDLSHNKHVRGLVRNGHSYYRFWGRLGFTLNFSHISTAGWTYGAPNLTDEFNRCKNAGYIEIDVETIERRWPEFRYEIESPFLIEKLSNA